MGRQKSIQTINFQQRKATFLSKDDKSSAGGIDAHAREVCAVINSRSDAFTTSSCSGRAFLWRGEGVKSTSKFTRYRVAHDLIQDAESYFNLESLAEETVDGAWETEMHRTRERSLQKTGETLGCRVLNRLAQLGGCACGGVALTEVKHEDKDPVVWLRFEPFILHVCCRDFASAANVIAAARSVFKNAGVQSWSEGKVMIAIWGDEGLEMALTDPKGKPVFKGQTSWLEDLVNSRHHRNWAKIDRFTEALRSLPPDNVASGLTAGGALESTTDTDEGSEHQNDFVDEVLPSRGERIGPKHFDVIGDVAVVPVLPAESDRGAIGSKVLAENRKVRIVAARCGSLQTDHRKPVSMEIIAGPDRKPLITTHTEFGVRFVINLEAVFFNPRMGPERQRICTQVQSGDHVCVLFAGCCPEALQIADKTSAKSIVAIELNPDAVRCARRSLDLLSRRDANKASRVQIIEGEACAAAAELPRGEIHRVVAPRPKGTTESQDDELVSRFLHSIVPLLRPEGVCHWYDFVADWEFPSCKRSVGRISDACARLGRQCTILRCAAANNKPVAERQYRTVIDFMVS